MKPLSEFESIKNLKKLFSKRKKESKLDIKIPSVPFDGGEITPDISIEKDEESNSIDIDTKITFTKKL